MITIEKTQTFGWEAALRGMRNPKNSWNLSDTTFISIKTNEHLWTIIPTMGPNDIKLAKALCKGGSDDRKFIRDIHVQMDVTAPLYWWKEFDTYKVGTVSDSCSTMHKIHSKEFDINDFSHEHLTDVSKDVLAGVCAILNMYRNKYVESKEKDNWWQLIQLLPTSYNQKRTIDLNYEVLRNMYHARKFHKLDEWHTLCAWIETLPYSKELIIGEE